VSQHYQMAMAAWHHDHGKPKGQTAAAPIMFVSPRMTAMTHQYAQQQPMPSRASIEFMGAVPGAWCHTASPA